MQYTISTLPFSFTTVLLILIAVAGVHSAGSCATVSQKLSSQWNNNGPYSQWDVTITVTSSSPLTLSFGTAPDSSWNIESQPSGMFKLPSYAYNNGAISTGTYSFGYIVKSSSSSVITPNCGSSSSPSTPTQPPPTQAPPTQAPIPATPRPATQAPPTPIPATPKPPTQAPPTATPTPATQAPPTVIPTWQPATVTPTGNPVIGTGTAQTLAATCSVVFVIDSYITRRLGESQARDRYTQLFADTQKFFASSFAINLTRSHMYFENPSSSFTDTMNDGVLLDSFRSALVGNVFPGLPQGACVYHLITGRQPPGIGGLSWIGTACNNADAYNNGFTVDGLGAENPVTVIRRLTHEIGHIFGGQHFDWYGNNPAYTCDNGESRSDQRILRGVEAAPDYNFLSSGMFFSPCSVTTIKSTLPAFSCLWSAASSSSGAASTPAVATATLYSQANHGGSNQVIPAYNGIQGQCYNLVYPMTGITTSYKITGNSAIKGMRIFAAGDCKGVSFDVTGATSNYVGDAAANQAYSFQYII